MNLVTIQQIRLQLHIPIPTNISDFLELPRFITHKAVKNEFFSIFVSYILYQSFRPHCIMTTIVQHCKCNLIYVILHNVQLQNCYLEIDF